MRFDLFMIIIMINAGVNRTTGIARRSSLTIACVVRMQTARYHDGHHDYDRFAEIIWRQDGSMKVSKEKAAEHHQAVIEAAATSFRESGFGGVNVADIMRKAGLTHGAFYGHFSSKSDLAAAACRYAFDDRLNGWADDISLTDYLDRYLSTLHRDRPGRGCPMAAFASDISRQPKAVQKEFEVGVARYRERIASRLAKSGARKVNRDSEATALLAAMVGSIVLARSTRSDRTLSARILTESRSVIALRFGV
jgi:TetR/AcrR family transcriptional repressor of nem operon